MNDALFARNLGNTIRRLRLSQGVSQEKFAILCSLHRTYIGAIERGEKNITVITAMKIATALDISLAQLFYEFEREHTIESLPKKKSENDENSPDLHTKSSR